MDSQKILHFLVVEDEPEIADIICLFVGAQLSAHFTIAHSGNEAVSLLAQENLKFDFVISDFNMPHGNGNVVYDYVKVHFPDLPFILVTSDLWADHPEFHGIPKVGYVQKPFIDENIVAVIEQLLKVTDYVPSRDHQYVGVSLNTLEKIEEILYPLFVRINETQHLKIMNSLTRFDHEESERFRQKNIKMLYVEKIHFNDFIQKFKNKVTQEMVFRDSSPNTQETLALSISMQEMVLGAVKTFGWNQETQEMALKNLQIVKNLVAKNQELHSIVQWANDADQDHIFVHSVLISYMTTAIAQNYHFKSQFALESMAMAAFFHDAALDEHHVKNEARFIKSAQMNLHMNREDIKWIKDHPLTSANMLSMWAPCPPEVLTIIKEHHEKPDGSGFPMGKINTDICELSACFIVAEDLVNTYLDLKDRKAVEKHLIDCASIYNVTPFQVFYQNAVEIFNKKIPETKTA